MAESFDRVGLARTWDFVTNVLSPEKNPVLDAGTQDADAGREKEFEQALTDLDKVGMLHLVPAWFQQSLQDDIRRRVSKAFWKFYDPAEHPSINDKANLARQFALSVDFLHNITQVYTGCMRTLRKVQHMLSMKAIANESGVGCRRAGAASAAGCGLGRDGLEDQLVLSLKAFIFSAFPKTFRASVEMFYSQNFGLFRREEVEESPEEGLSTHDIMDRFTKVNSQLHTMGLLEHISGSAITLAVTEHIRNYIQNSCKGDFQTPYLHHLEKYLDSKVMEWLRMIYKYSDENQCIDAFRGRLMHFICETYGDYLIEEMFNIIIEFPESEPAIKDLRRCLENIDSRSKLVTSMRKNFELRLLHPGVNTNHILTAYVSAIRALRALDPAGVILELICDPVRKYLRSREDTVRTIVASLTDTEGNNDLVEELLKGTPQQIDDKVESDDETENWETWEPDPVDANPETASKRRREQDIISTLVNIYGSRELFVAEYRTLLADRILSTSTNNIASATAGGDLERELRYLELLKLRFGEVPLHFCQIMLKDVADSRRINSRIGELKQHNGEDTEAELNAIILSAQFWPQFREEKVTLPPQLQSHLDSYTHHFETLKGNRTLVWKSHLGTVNLEIELKGQTVHFSVTPIQAAIIVQFQEQNQWAVEDLAQALEMTPMVLRRKLAFWQTQGLLKEDPTDVFTLVEDRKVTGQEVMAADDDDDEEESAMASAAQQREEEMQTFWTYITGMLQNLDCLPLERIHSMLRMFAVQGPDSGVTPQQLKAFLDRKVREQKLVFAAGVYRLPK